MLQEMQRQALEVQCWELYTKSSQLYSTTPDPTIWLSEQDKYCEKLTLHYVWITGQAVPTADPRVA